MPFFFLQHHKKSSLLLFGFFFFMIFSSPKTTFAQTCEIENGPIKELSEYSQNISKELSEIAQKSSGWKCENNISQQASRVFDLAYADLSAIKHTLTDFQYNTIITARWNPRSAVLRDEKIFKQIEKVIENTTERIAANCGLNTENRKQIKEIIIETNILKEAFQKAAIGSISTSSEWIRPKYQNVFKRITEAYHPANTNSCNNDSLSAKDFWKTMKWMLNLWGKLDDSLSTWRKALALLRGGWKWLTPSEYQIKKRQLLEAELSRQGMTANMQNAILRNFDCFEAKTHGENNAENIVNARISCLSNPILWADQTFADFKNFINKSETIWELSQRKEKLVTLKSRSVDIGIMHETLKEIIKYDNENHSDITTSFIKLHARIQSTNTLLEKRLPKMQNNCMKWQPDVIGWCRN